MFSLSVREGTLLDIYFIRIRYGKTMALMAETTVFHGWIWTI